MELIGMKDMDKILSEDELEVREIMLNRRASASYARKLKAGQDKHRGKKYKLNDGSMLVVSDVSKEKRVDAEKIIRLVQEYGADGALEIIDKQIRRGTDEHKHELLDFIHENRNGYLDPTAYLYNIDTPINYIEDAEKLLKYAIKNKEYNPDYVITKEESKLQRRNRTLFVKEYKKKRREIEKKRREEEMEAYRKEQKRLEDEALKEEMKQYREELRQESLEKLRKRKESDAQVLDDMLHPKEGSKPKVFVDHQKESRVVGDYRDSLLEHVPEELEKNMRLWLDYTHDKYRKDREIRGKYLEYLDNMKENIPGLVSEYQQFSNQVYSEINVNLGRLGKAEGKRVEDFKEDAMTKYLIEDQKKNIMSAVSLNRRINELLWTPRG